MTKYTMIENISDLQASPDYRISALEEKLAEQANNFCEISRVGALVTSFLELDHILPSVMESALAVVKAEVGQMIIFGDYNAIQSDICWGLSRMVHSSIVNGDNENLSDFIKETGNSIKIDDMESDAEWHGHETRARIKSILAVPLKSHSRIVGAAIVANKIDGDSFSDDDLTSLEMLAGFAAVAIENSEIHRQKLAQQKLDSELSMAREVQRTLMPQKTLELGQLIIHAQNRMALQVGGDFYDVIQLSPHKYLLVVADVSSKGLPAALLMTSTRSLVRAFAGESADLPTIVRNVNRQLCRDADNLRGMFVTMIFVCFDFESGVVKSINAGHPPGFLRYPDGKIAELKIGGPFLGQFDNLEFFEDSQPLVLGQRLFLYTDGAYECLNDRREMLGLSGLKELFKMSGSGTAQDFMGQLDLTLSQYSSDPERIDDTTYLIADVTSKPGHDTAVTDQIGERQKPI